MSISRSAAYAISVLAAAALVAGCNGASQSTGLTPSSGTGTSMASHGGHGYLPLGHRMQDAFIGAGASGAVHPNHAKSWISPDIARAPRLFFSSDYGNAQINVYAMPSMTLKATLTGFSGPQGMCSDSGGNVYVANTNYTEVLKLSRTGSVLATYSDTYGYPVGCAVDPATGNLAVSDIFGFSGAGQVLVYTSPSSSPTVLSNPSQYFYYFVGYGPGSSLWVSGRNSYGTYMLSGCGSSSCSTIPLSGGTVYFPGAVQWDNTRGDWVVFDQLCNGTNASCSYPVSGSGVLGTATVYNNYNGSGACDMVQGTIAAHGMKYVAGGDYEYCGAASSTAGRWAYTAGGNPTNYATGSNNYFEPIGAAISTK
jgi:hypothetical protein